MLAGLLTAPLIMLSMGATQLVSASTLTDGAKAARGDSVDKVCMFKHTTKPNGDPLPTDDPKYCKDGIFTSIVNVALFLIGAISVIMIVYGGIRYTTSGGNDKNVTAAKDTILYAVVGLVVAILAYAIVNFVITKLT